MSKASLLHSRSSKLGSVLSTPERSNSRETVADSGLEATLRRGPTRKSQTLNNRRSNLMTTPMTFDAPAQESPLARHDSISLPGSNDFTTVASRFKTLLSSTRSSSRSKQDESSSSNFGTEVNSLEQAPKPLSFLSFALKSSRDSSNSSSDDFGQLKPNQRSWRQSITDQVTNSFVSISRPKSIVMNDAGVETAKVPEKVSEPELEGPIFNATIQQASTLGCKNGVPDIVVQCIEYLERKKFLTTEGLYRVPGSQKRVKEWCAKYRDIYNEREKKCLVLDRRRSLRKTTSRPRSVSEKAPSVKQKSSLKKTSTTDDMMITCSDQMIRPKKTAQESNFSLTATIGSYSTAKSNSDELKELSSPMSSYLSINQSIISLKFEESKRGVGLWGSEGLFSTVGFPLTLDNETPSTIASLLKRYFSSVKDNFTQHGFWAGIDSMAITSAANSPPSEDILNKIRFYIELNIPSRQHLHTFAYFLLHLQRVAALAETNMMTPKNLALCIFTSAKEGGEFVIRFADLIFGNIDIVGREAVACLPFSEITTTFPDVEDNPVELPKWDSTIDDLEPRLMQRWFDDIIPLITPSTATSSSRVASTVDTTYDSQNLNVDIAETATLKPRYIKQKEEQFTPPASLISDVINERFHT